MPVVPATAPTSKRDLWLFGSLWSLRQYPSAANEWDWETKLAALRDQHFDGVFSPPHPVLRERGSLRYWAATSIDTKEQVEPVLASAAELGAISVNVQLGDYDSRLPEMVSLAERIHAVARDRSLPFTIETHRDTFTETPERTLALLCAFRAKTGAHLPLCLDHSHFAVVRHLRPGEFWERLRHPPELLEAAANFHLRPFNGHHCQLPVLEPGGGFCREYRDWQAYALALFQHLRTRADASPVWVVPELGHENPAYRLSCFGDTWRDLLALAADLRALWRAAG